MNWPVDDDLRLTLEPGVAADGTAALSREASRLLVNALHVAPCGVERMSTAVPGVVETSNNLGW